MLSHLFSIFIEKHVQNTESSLGSESHLIGNKKKKFHARSSWMLIPASVCDMTGISLSYFALTLTSVSSYEMLKGSVIIFTGINSKLFLKRQMSWKKWASMVVILIGLIIVGLADVIQPADKVGDENNATLNSTFEHVIFGSEVDAKCNTSGNVLSNEVVGDIMIVGAQIFMSFQFVYEEKVLSSYDIAPLQAVGWEGLYGLIIMSVLLVPLSYIDLGSCIFSNSPSPPWTLEDPIDGFIQLGNNGLLLFLFCFYVVLVAFYMYESIAVTKEFNATTRMVLESTRSVIVWIVSVCVGWQHFQYLQLIGFCVMTIGIFLYNYKWT